MLLLTTELELIKTIAIYVPGVDPGLLEGRGANSRHHSLGWRCTPSMLELEGLGACPPPHPQEKC